MPVLITLVLLVSAFAMATPAMAADVALGKGVTPASPNEYRLGDTIHYTMSITLSGLYLGLDSHCNRHCR
jgi:hypothetical protein